MVGRIGSLTVRILAVAGLVAAWLALVALAEQAAPGERIDFGAPHSTFYYLSHGIAILSVLGAGCLSAIRGAFRILGTGARVAFCVLFGTAAAWSITAYTVEQLLSTTAVGATGAAVWFSLVFVLAGTDPRVLDVADRVICVLAYLTAALAGWALFTSGPLSYDIGMSKPTLYAVILIWTGGWMLLGAASMGGLALWVRAIPYFVLMLTMVASLSRSGLLQAGLLGMAFLFQRWRRLGRAQAMRTAGGALLLLAGWGVVAYFAMPQHVSSAMAILDRLGDDTRSGQYLDFFRDVHPAELLLGRGPKGTWFWSVVGDYQFFDNGYLWMLFIGGVPTLVSYVAIVLWPALQLLRRRPGDLGTSTCMILLYGVALTGLSTFTLPSLSLNNYLVSLWAGQCHMAVVCERVRLVAPNLYPHVDLMAERGSA